jgi:gamma-glutamyltranspeptidase/glutathione hydrolase
MGDWFKAANSNDSKEREKTEVKPLPFKSRRSPVVCTNGCVASSQPLASSTGLQILLQGGNAADAALAMAAALAVTEPCSTGLGGDMFSLYYESKSKSVHCVNGSGRCPAGLSLDAIRKKYPSSGSEGGVDVDKHRHSVDAITIPMAARGWEEFYNRHSSGKFTFGELLEPAAKLAEGGFPVAPMTSMYWCNGVETLVKKWHGENDGKDIPISNPLMVEGTDRGPRPGEIIKNPDMAKVLRSLGSKGATKGFYESSAGEAIVSAVQKFGGCMTMDDLKEDQTQCTFPESIFVKYKGLKVHQIPPNGQGIAGLIALSGLNSLEENGQIPVIDSNAASKDLSGWNSSQLWHAMIEMMRLGFGDARKFVCDEEFCLEKERDIKTHEYLLDESRISEKVKTVFDAERATVQGIPDPTSCTVSFQVVDKDGNAVSFVNSNFTGFGTGLVPDGCGFTLQNRGAGFSFEDDHPNVIEPGKRPYHTIIPAMVTHADTDELYATISNMGGFMQPQGHMQLTVALANGLDPQAAIDQPRFSIADGTHNGVVMLEEGVNDETVSTLEKQGHRLVKNVSGYDRSIFGKAQIIKRVRETGVLWAGSDGRSDGCAMGF